MSSCCCSLAGTKACETCSNYPSSYYTSTSFKNDFRDITKITGELASEKPERKKGEWIYYERREPQYDIEGVKTYAVVYRCSECGFLHTVIEDFGRYNFCPKCGADMRDEENG